MFNESMDKIIEEANLIIKHALKDKTLLAISMFAVVVVLFSLLFKLNKLEWVGVLITVSISMTRALEYSHIHNGEQEKKMIMGSEMFFQTVVAIIIGIVIFYDKTIQNPHYILDRISGNKNLIFAICLTAPAVITIFSKIIWSSGEPLYGGIISGHAAFVSALLMINIRAETQYLWLIIPIISVLMPRCMQTKRWIKKLLKISGGISMLFVCIKTIIDGNGIVLITANILMFALVLLCQGRPVHRKKEISFGMILGMMCSALIMYISK